MMQKNYHAIVWRGQKEQSWAFYIQESETILQVEPIRKYGTFN